MAQSGTPLTFEAECERCGLHFTFPIDRFKDKSYINWLMSSLGLQYAKEGLEGIIETTSQEFYNNIKQDIQAAATCSQCDLSVTKSKNPNCVSNCPRSACGPFKQTLENHTTSCIDWTRAPYRNITSPATLVATFLPAFMTSSYTSPLEADMSAFLNLLEWCVPFKNKIGDLQLVKKVRESRNAIMHSGTMRMDTEKLNEHLSNYIALLEDKQHLQGDNKCKEAITNIKQAFLKINAYQRYLSQNETKNTAECKHYSAELWLLLRTVICDADVEMKQLTKIEQEVFDKVDQTHNLEIDEIRQKLESNDCLIDEAKTLKEAAKKLEEKHVKLKVLHEVYKLDTTDIDKRKAKCTTLYEDVERSIEQTINQAHDTQLNDLKQHLDEEKNKSAKIQQSYEENKNTIDTLQKKLTKKQTLDETLKKHLAPLQKGIRDLEQRINTVEHQNKGFASSHRVSEADVNTTGTTGTVHQQQSASGEEMLISVQDDSFVQELPLEIKVKEKKNIKLECQLTKPYTPVTWLSKWSKRQLPAEIQTKMCDVEVKENEIIKLQCQLTKPDKPVTWFKDDTEITADDHLNIIVAADTHQIVISQATIDDAGKYSCVCGDARTNCTVSVEELPAEIKRKLCDIEIRENDIMKLECQLTKPDKPVTWLKDDIEINADEHLNITMATDTHTLVISKATVADAGKYSCVCGDAWTECLVTIEELPTEIKTKLCDVKVTENEIIKLQCQLTKPDTPVTWLKDDTEITADDHLNIAMDADTHQIVISQATLDDDGKYSCVCGDYRTECLVTVEELHTEIKTNLCDVVVTESDIIKLECQLTKPDKPVTWLKYDTKITADDHLNITMDADTHTLIISKATVADAGKYSCVCGDAWTECLVTIEELPTEIKTKLCDVKVTENEIIKLQCQLAKPDTPVTWLKDDTEITADDHLNITMDADTHQIVISQAILDDDGKYSCVCGDYRTECLVTVEELHTEIKTNLCDVDVKENDIIKLECQLTKPDKPVTWLKDDTEITADDHLNITMTADTHQIVISQATLDDAGQYSCVCGDVKTECTVTVKARSIEVKATKVGTINVRTADDHYSCNISGSALLPGDKLVLADYNNSKLKLVNLQTSEVTSQLKVSNPWDVASITKDQVAFTLPNARKIVFVTVTSVLKQDRKMSVDGRCTGIVYNNSRLIVAFNAPVKIQIMTLDGQVEKNIECSSIFNFPSNIALSPTHDAIYVADHLGNSIKRLGLDGEVEAEYENEQLRGPTGVVVDQQGRVIVCGEVSFNLHLLTADLTKIKLLVNGLSHPNSLSLCHSTGRLYVGRADNNVSVYQLS